MKRYVIVGASVAGLSAIDVLRQQDKEAEIVLVSEESDLYSKCILHHYMAGTRPRELLASVAPDFMEANRVIWRRGVRAGGLDPKNKSVRLSDGEALSYDKLLLATGSHAFVPPVEGLEGAKNARVFHTLDDCEAILSAARRAEDIVILGAGLVGVDVACGLADRGKRITLVDVREHLLALQLDGRAAAPYEEAFRSRGVAQRYGVGLSRVEKNGARDIAAAVLSDGARLPCDLLILATGARANTEWLRGSGAALDERGLVIDETCKTNLDGVYGAGDITGRDLVWPVAAQEGRIAACNMARGERRKTPFFAGKATIHLFGIPTMAYGLHDAPDDTYQVETAEGPDGAYRKVIHRDGRVCGALLQRDLSYAGVLNQLICNGMDVSALEKPLLQLDYADFLPLAGREAV